MVAILDWRERIREGRSLIPIEELNLDHELAEEALDRFKNFRLMDVAGTPRIGEVAAPFIYDIVRTVFGSYNPETNTRSIRHIYVQIPKKNSKTTYGALIMLLQLLINQTYGQKLVMVAPSSAIAHEGFDQARNAVDQDRHLRAMFKCRKGQHDASIYYEDTNSTLQLQSLTAGGLTGIKALATMVDETHQCARSRSEAANIFTQLKGSLMTRLEGFMMQFTTQSPDWPVGIFKAEMETARAIRDGVIERDDYLPVIYEFDEEIIENGWWKNPRLWELINPNLNRSVSLKALKEQYREERSKGPQDEAIWCSQYLNMEVGGKSGLGRSGWEVANKFWDAAKADFTLADMIEQCSVITVGLDLGGLRSLLGLAFLGRRIPTEEGDDPDQWMLWSRAWCTDIAWQRNKKYVDAYQGFRDDGDLVVYPDDHFELIYRDISELIVQVLPKLPHEGRGIALDKAGYSGFEEVLEAYGVNKEHTRVVKQGAYLEPQIEEVERKLVKGNLKYAQSNMLSWMIQAVDIILKGGRQAVERDSLHGNHDCILAMLDAAALMMEIPARISDAPLIYHPALVKQDQAE